MDRDRGRHAADRAGSGDKDVLADQVKLEGRVGRVPERIEAGEDVERDGGVDGDGVCRRDAEELGEGAVAVHADPLRVLAQVPAPRQAVAAHAADDVALAVHEVALLEPLDRGADLLDHADKLVADDHRGLDRLLGPVVPIVNVDVGAADGRLLDPDQDVVGPGDGDRVFRQVEAGPGLQL